VTVELYVGLMSGTSLDGVDAVLASCEDDRVECRAAHYRPFDKTVRAEALALQDAGHDELHRAALLANRLAESYAQAVNTLLAEAGTTAAAVRAIGCHGQTVRHAPESRYTLQLNNPALLAERTGIAVVADFRSRDIAAGGQGAPLVPAFHDALFRTAGTHRVILNIGGIANLTDLAPGRATTGFDCGPGNMLLDAWVQLKRGQPYDEDGHWARQGRVLPQLLVRLLAHPFLALPPPKSCGREQFNLAWLQTQLKGAEPAEDVQATLTQLTAIAATTAIRGHCDKPDELYVCGGGAHNGALMSAIAEQLPGSAVARTDILGLRADWVEATAFAWLARRTVLGQTGNLPAVTGARGVRVLGAVYPA
jgi:anhydro-N-acetylmuramic acid kinase